MQQLRLQLGHWEAAPAGDAPLFSSGAAAIDRLLPSGGLRHGMLVEWLGGESSRAVERKSSRAVEREGFGYCSTALPLFCSSAAVTLSLLAAREACREGGTLVVIDRQQNFYPPAAAGWGIDLERLIVVRPRSARDELWAAVQSLRSSAVAAVWGMIDRLDSRAFRRLQLAAQAGRTLGLFLRPPSARGQPSWADVRLEVSNCGLTSADPAPGTCRSPGAPVEPRISDFGLIQTIRNPGHPAAGFAGCRVAAIRNHLTRHSLRRIQVRVLRTHGGRPGGSTTLEIEDATYTVREASSRHDTHPLPVVAELADPADRSFPARA
jgi:hypothetical protein